MSERFSWSFLGRAGASAAAVALVVPSKVTGALLGGRFPFLKACFGAGFFDLDSSA